MNVHSKSQMRARNLYRRIKTRTITTIQVTEIYRSCNLCLPTSSYPTQHTIHIQNWYKHASHSERLFRITRLRSTIHTIFKQQHSPECQSCLFSSVVALTLHSCVTVKTWLVFTLPVGVSRLSKSASKLCCITPPSEEEGAPTPSSVEAYLHWWLMSPLPDHRSPRHGIRTIDDTGSAHGKAHHRKKTDVMPHSHASIKVTAAAGTAATGLGPPYP